METKLDPYYAYIRERNLNNQLHHENMVLKNALHAVHTCSCGICSECANTIRIALNKTYPK